MFDTDRSKVVRQLNRPVRYAIQNQISLKILGLEVDTLRILGYFDSSFANNRNLYSQLGHICFLRDKSGAVAPIYFESYMARRVTRSVMFGEVIAFSDLFDVSVTCAEEIGVMLSRNTPVQLLTESKSIFDVFDAKCISGPDVTLSGSSLCFPWDTGCRVEKLARRAMDGVSHAPGRYARPEGEYNR